MPFVRANDLNLYYETHGDGPPLLLIAGFNQSSLSYLPFIDPLSKHFRVILFDNRGTGQSDAPEGGYTIKMFAEDTAALLDQLEIESCHILGTSMGTLIAQKICIDHSDRVKKVILCAPFAKLPNIAIHNIRTQLKLLTKGFSPGDLMELNAAWLLSNKFLGSEESIRQFLKDIASNPYPSTPQGVFSQAEALCNADLRQEVEKIPHEVLLLVGEQDIDSPPYCAEFLQQKIPNCRIHLFKDMGHMFNYENPLATCKRVLEFLSTK